MASKITKESIDRFYDYDLFLETRTLYMGSQSADEDGNETGTDYAMSEKVIKGLHILENKAIDDITIIMNNVGGDVHHGDAIIDSIRACRSNITIIVRGQAMSMGALILQAADHRVIAPSATFMAHYGDWGAPSGVKDQERWMDECKRRCREMEDVFLARINQKREKRDLSIYKRQQLQRKMNNDWILSASECVDWGFADEIEYQHSQPY